MAAETNLQISTLNIPANGTVRLNGLFDFFSCVAAAGPFNVRFDDAPPQPWQAGFEFRVAGKSIESIYLTDASGSVNSVSFVAGSGEFTNNNLTLSGALSVSRSKNLGDTADVSLPAAVTTLILSANSARRQAVITNLSAVKTLRIGTGDAGAARGAAVAPGATIVLNTEAAIYGYNPVGSEETVSVLEVKD